ncbi:cytochrome d ubiquinol oxidase subunit II [uncultured Senegalimassilia sp.]|uniref:cytochrome d ubiquinol oxidase subunit II n=1 Tax=uncultured Senegalimassilia sp. TaxID=1714350 RepID=UPI0027DAFB58|nr:cytochrome d ubiquinol oxidase subunit II [uncultured Senegalimassilia sp.]
MSALAVLWFFLIFVLIAGYFVLDGFDLGVGVLYRALAKDERERALVRRSIGPVWDGNEVWLLTAGGALFAAFPAAYATTFSGFYLAVMLVLFGLIVRAVSLEFRAHDPKWARAWDVCFTVGSFLPALLLGVALGNVIAGIPMAANGDYAGVPLLGLLSPFTLVAGLLGLAMCLSAGSAWVALKAPAGSAVHKRVAKLRVPCQIAALALFAVATTLVFAVVKPVFAPGMFAAGAVIALVFLVCVVASIVLGRKGNDLVAFLLQSVAAVCLVALAAVTLFPNLVVAAPGSVGASITLMSAASSDTSLAWMTGIACVGVPLVLAYHVIAYRVFRGRLDDKDVNY